MPQRIFTKDDFVNNSNNEYEIEYHIGEVGIGANLIVEKRDENGEYEVIQPEMTRVDDSMFIRWSEPFEGRLIYED
ncbi:glutathione synthase [uncultured Chryseobacterium sp.]|uniref:glutathione synthase n=1 Tax=uncultured Chryseobacterium sp. TaxID=259322 RepID=UPI0025D9F6AB|nr:glutathione synthase [uncultured Chryseobacterium sp.]